MDTRERLVESTRELLWERGYVGTSPAAILERAQVGQGSMYHFFRGKSDLAQAAMERTAEVMKQQIAADLLGPGSAYERISGYLRRDRDVLKGCPVGRMTLDPEIFASEPASEPLEEMFSWLASAMRDVLEEGRRAGEFSPELPAQQVATALVAVVQGGYVLARAAHEPARFDEAVDGALALLAAYRRPQR
ncbi:TetR/AcrR family transcriptional regulator [Amnibacterium sp. CER49]|uniref:TetR/AcrR family transcriptional regulator n=1 Tax=Amnibacterium sp. CER49 TaxID=3039161 RepID=UPI00244BAC08|nr:TetR/AcrR family transcriptional regulator [Amnibacterium sp. CER49]MDH2443516.1 TetR/AcrR family transcriptional regulator [Amnibacterium sp. CER49]